jgi:hypothetical protein
MRLRRLCTVAAAITCVGALLSAQGRGNNSEWPTTHGDAQRTSWIRTDSNISIDSLSKPGFELQWKTKLDNRPRQSHSLAQGVTVNGVTLFTPLALVTGSSNNIYAVDTDTGYTFWQRHFDAPLPAGATAACPGGLTAAATRMTNLAPPAVAAGRGAPGLGAGRGGTGYRSSVGAPGEGVPADLAQRGSGGGARAGAPAGPGGPGASGGPGAPGGAAGPGGAGAPGGAGLPAAQAGAAGAVEPDPSLGGGAVGGAGAPNAAARGAGARGAAPGGGGGFGRASGVVYAVSSDGLVHTLGLPSGKDIQKPAPFVPANARLSDPVAVNQILYAATSRDCGGVPNAVWAIDLSSADKLVASWKTNGGSPVGSLALTTDGTVVVAIGAGKTSTGGYSNAIVALDGRTLQPKDWFTQPATEFVSGPLVFRRDEKDVVAAATKDGRILLLDAASLGGANHATPLSSSRSLAANPGAFAPEAMASWQETIQAPVSSADTPPAAGTPAVPGLLPGTQWLLVPVAGRLAADAQLPTSNGAVTNGAIIALKIVNDAGKLSLEPGWVSRDLIAPTTPVIVNGVVFAASSGRAPGTPAVLYGLNGTSGKELWNSGDTIASFVSGSSPWSGAGQVYIGTFDGTVYAYGFAMERK